MTTALAPRRSGGALYQPKAAHFAKHKAAHKRALVADMRHIPMVADPASPTCPRSRYFDFFEGRKVAGRPEIAAHRDLVLYAAAIGQKRGTLPADLSGFTVDAERRADGSGMVTFSCRQTVIPVEVAFLDWEGSFTSEELPAIAAPVEAAEEAEPYRCDRTAPLALPAPGETAGPAGNDGDQASGSRLSTGHGDHQPKTKRAPRARPKVITIIGRRGCQSFAVPF
jgi:hypothetical protein